MIRESIYASMVIILIVSPLLGQIKATTSNNEMKSTLSVCEALSELKELSGRTVKIRGEWRSDDHGVWLAASEKCSKNVVVDGYEWSNSFHLIEDKASNLDFLSLAKFEIALDQNRGKRSKEQVFFEDQILVEVVGILQSTLPLIVVRLPGKLMPGNGYGHLNFHPAQISLQAIQLIRVGPRSKLGNN